jgi:hypothetical protein
MKIDKPLNGASIEPERPKVSIRSLFDGSFQTAFEKYFGYKLVGRATMTRIYNQIIFSIFNSTDTYIQIGKEGYLFEPWYPIGYLTEPDTKAIDDLEDKIRLLANLQSTLNNLGKTSLVIITPSKASLYSEYLPSAYRPYVDIKARGGYSPNFYELFNLYAKEMGVLFFDAHKLLLEQKEEGKDIFVKGGTHWTASAVVPYFNQLTTVLNEKLQYPIGTIKTIKETPVWSEPFMADGDLETVLNLFPKSLKIFPRYQFYSPHIETISEPTECCPSVFVVGGSFNWTWLSMVYGKNGWLDNGTRPVFGITEFSYYNGFVTQYPENIHISETTENFASVLDKDIIIIEFNEQAIFPEAPQFRFIENLLEYMQGR